MPNPLLSAFCSAVVLGGAWLLNPPAHAAAPVPVTDSVAKLGELNNNDITESSGVVASRKHAGVFWTHNDGGDNHLYAVDREGKTLGKFTLEGVSLNDWEDIAIDGAGHLFVADIGDKVARNQVDVYQIVEPASPKAGGKLTVQRHFTLQFPFGQFDSESLLIQGATGYLISKQSSGERQNIFRFSLSNYTKPQKLIYLTTVPIQAPIAGADLSADGKHLAVVTNGGLYLFTLQRFLSTVGRVTPRFVPIPDDAIEGCTFVKDGVLVTSEKQSVYLVK